MPQLSMVQSEAEGSDGNSWATPPAADQIELTLFGPGFGESAVVHLGDDRWAVIDSCIFGKGNIPAGLDYLKSLGRDPAECVKLIVATHWHDDHIRGLSALLGACRNAIFACSDAFKTHEFQAMIIAFDRQRLVAGGSGAREINKVFLHLEERPEKPPRLASASKRLFVCDTSKTAHKRNIEIVALSPSDYECKLALKTIAKLMPEIGETQYRCPAEQPNLASVAVTVTIGETVMLLGADLECHSDDRRGWAAVIADSTLPKSKSLLFKVPHHGSAGADMPEIWENLVETDALAVTSPWARGSKHLPTSSDIARILSHTSQAYLTAKPLIDSPKYSYPRAVQKQLREMDVKIRPREPTPGAVRFRNFGNANWDRWTVVMLRPALKLTSAHAAGG